MESTAKIFNSYEVNYYNSSLRQIIKILRSGEKLYTHSFTSISEFSGRVNRPLLRRALRTLESFGYVTNIDLGSNIHQWQITESGKELAEVQAKDPFIKLTSPNLNK